MQPDAFKIGSLAVHWYGVLVALGFIAGLWTAGRRAKLIDIEPAKVHDIGPWLILGGVGGGRVLYVISYWHEKFSTEPWWEVFAIWRGGLVFYGGLIGATLAGMCYVWLKKLPLWKMADILAPSIALGYAFGRIGCLMNGCCYGRACSLPWAIHFPSAMGTDGVLHPHPSGGIGVHPTEIYDSLLNFGFYAVLAWLFRRRKFDGEIFAIYLIGYAIIRSFVEYFRGDYPVHYLGGWATPAQVISLIIVTSGLLLIFLLPRPQPNKGQS